METTTIQQILANDHSEQRANAKLIATAPELLSELENVTQAYVALLNKFGQPFEWGFLVSDRALEVIAKAKGE